MCTFVFNYIKKMKIIYIYNSFTIARGADREIIEKANYLAEHGYDITIVTESQQERQPFFHLSPKVKLHDLEIDFEQIYKYNSLIRIFKYFSLKRRHEGILREHLYKERPDIVITTLGRDMLFLTDIKDGSIKIGESYIAKPYVRNLNILENKGPFHRMIAKIWMRKIIQNCKKLDALVLLTNDEANNWKGQVDTFVIPSPLSFNPKDNGSSNNTQTNTQRYAKDIVMEKWINLLDSLYKKKGKKIMYIFSELTIKGGTDKVITYKANYLSTHGYDVTIVTETQMGRPHVFPLSNKVKTFDIGLNFNKQYSQSFFHRAITYFLYIHIYKNRLKKIIKKEKPDIVITTMGRSLDFISRLKDSSIKIGEAHTTKYHLRSLHLMEEKGIIYKWIAKSFRRRQISNARKLSALVLLTPEDANDWKGITNTYVIPNSIQSMPHEASKLNQKRAIMVGRYNEAKGYEYLVEAWDIVYQKHPDWCIDIYGSGELHDDVENWIKEKHLENTIIMHEPTNQIMDKYLESSICIVSSRYEGFSMAIVEAMASGVPCVSFDCPYGPRNIIKDEEDGILVEHLNSKALADNICRLIEDDNLRIKLGANARVNIQRFSEEKIMNQWINLINSLTNRE